VGSDKKTEFLDPTFEMAPKKGDRTCVAGQNGAEMAQKWGKVGQK
jgi:hypothetical protein